MINFKKCEKIFIDFDGVIVDSNHFKELAIERSIFSIIGENKKSINAINFFNKNAGLSRKKKLSEYFEDDEVLDIIKLYSEECQKFFSKALPTFGLKTFLKFLKENNKIIKIYILSGGEKEEISSFLKKNSLHEYFEDVLSSDKSKIEHLKEKQVTKNDIFIGDSQTDLNASVETGIGFILIAQFKSPKSFPSEKIINDNYFLKTENFVSLMEEISL